MKTKAQIATEYVIIVGFAILIIIPLALIFSRYIMDTQSQVTSTQADRISKQIVDAAESVYYMGAPSKTTIKVYMPKDVISINITSKEITFVISTKAGPSEVSKPLAVNITGTIPSTPGMKTIELTSKGSYVELNAT
jgi:uncharacterized protein (UPF0333 family)